MIEPTYIELANLLQLCRESEGTASYKDNVDLLKLTLQYPVVWTDETIPLKTSIKDYIKFSALVLNGTAYSESTHEI